ncbi:hypothetical protein [uncultured Robinsoniella sp.]|uniref:hypothetical protein n=2 Tax=uncultured Robinsoniella sp. TaxID=904190 RepID=UPI00374E401F
MHSFLKLKEMKTNHIILSGLCLFIIFFFLKDIIKLNGIVVINDEFGYWGIASHMAGKSWSGLLPTAPYYAFGYSLLLVPLYWLNIEPTAMYHIAIIFNVVFILASYIISICCIKKLFPQISNLKSYFICFALTFYTNNIIQAQVAWSETLLYFLVWLLFYIFILNVEKPKFWNYSAGIIVAVYMYYVHQRMIGVVLVYIVLILFNNLSKKENKKIIFSSVIIFAILFAIGNLVKVNIISNVFTNPELASMNDFGGQAGKIQTILFTKNGFLNFLQSIAGKFYYIGISTLLIGLGGLWVLGGDVLTLVNDLFKTKFKLYNNRQLISLFVFMAFLSLFLIDAISMYNNAGRLDVLVYGRYMEPAFGLIIFYGLTDLIASQKSKKFVIPQILVLLILSFVVNKGFIEANSKIFNGFCSSTIYFFFKYVSDIPNLSFYITLMLLIPGCMIWIINIKENKKTIYNFLTTLLIIIVSWGWLSSFSGALYQQEEAQNNIGLIIEKIKENENGDYKIIYVKDSNDEISSVGDINIKYLQYYFPNKTIEVLDIKDIIDIKEEGDLFLVMDNNSKAFDRLVTRYEIIENTNVFTLFYDNKNA